MVVEPGVSESLRREKRGDTLPDIAFRCSPHPGMLDGVTIAYDGLEIEA